MKNKLIKILISVTLALTLTLSLASCDTLFYDGLQNQNNAFNETKVSNSINVELNIQQDIGENSKDLCDVLEDIMPSVVEIYAPTSSMTASSGSGVIISLTDRDNDGSNDVAFIVTCHHVIESASEVIIKNIYGDTYDGYLIGGDPESDIAVVCCETKVNGDMDKLTKADIYDYSNNKLRVGTSVVAIGNPLGTLGGTVTSGIISTLSRKVTVEGKSMELLQTDCAINGGNSGGGLFTSSGVLVGMVNAGYASKDAQGLSFAIPSLKVFDIAEQLMSSYSKDSPGYVSGRCSLGADFTVFEDFWSGNYGVLVSALDIYGSAYKGGLKIKDRIISIEYYGEVFDVSNYNRNNLESALSEFIGKFNLAVGDKIKFSVLRNNKVVDLEIEILQYVYGK